MGIEQIPQGNMQQVFVPQMVPIACFVPSPHDFLPPAPRGETSPAAWSYGGCDAMWPHGGHRGQFNKSRGSRNDRGARTNRRDQGGPASPTSPQPSVDAFGFDNAWPPVESGEPVGVVLDNLPKMLCNKNCLEAALEQAGLENFVNKFDIQNPSVGTAILHLVNENAAQRCIRHFDGLKWTKGSEPVSARYFDDAKSPKAENCKDQEEPRKSQVETQAAGKQASGLSGAPKATPKPAVGLASKTSQFSSVTSPQSSPKTKRWADYDSDDDEDDQSTNFDGSVDVSDGGDSSNTE